MINIRKNTDDGDITYYDEDFDAKDGLSLVIRFFSDLPDHLEMPNLSWWVDEHQVYEEYEISCSKRNVFFVGEKGVLTKFPKERYQEKVTEFFSVVKLGPKALESAKAVWRRACEDSEFLRELEMKITD